MNLEKASSIMGWMNPAELEWLAEKASKCSKIAEIGSYQGRSTRAMGDNTEGKILAVDTWDTNFPVHPMMNIPKPLLPDDWMLYGFGVNLHDLIDAGKVIPWRAESFDAAVTMGELGEKFDMVFIDGSHEYEDVRDDILCWRDLLNPGGLLCGHDFTAKHMGVAQAVRELVPHFKVHDTIWYEAA